VRFKNKLAYQEMTQCTLICDARERSVLCHDHILGEIAYQVLQITTADYVICAPNGNILCAIERKSLKDYAASLKDGRSENKQKLIDLRTEKRCKIFYIIEGPAHPSADTMFCGIRYRNIQSSIFHLMMDDISIIPTSDTLDTARTLVAFVQSMNSYVRRRPEYHGAASGNNDTLTTPHRKTEDEIICDIWAAFPYISRTSATEYSRHWSIADISRKTYIADIQTFKINGRQIHARTLRALTNDLESDMRIAILAAIPGISRTTARHLAGSRTLHELLDIDIASERLAARHVGPALAQKIIKYLTYKIQ